MRELLDDSPSDLDGRISPEGQARTAINELYQCCHLPQPFVVFADSSKAYHDARSTFEVVSSDLVVVIYLLLAACSLLAGLLVAGLTAATLAVMNFHSPWTSNLCAELSFGTLGLCMAILVYLVFFRWAQPKNRARLVGLDNAAGKFPAIIRRGVDATSEAMMGSFSSALIVYTGNPLPVPLEGGAVPANSLSGLLRLGMQPVLPKSLHSVVAAATDVLKTAIEDGTVGKLPIVLQKAAGVTQLVDEAVLLAGVAIALLRGRSTPEPSLADGLDGLPGPLRTRYEELLGKDGKNTLGAVKATLDWPDLEERAAIYRLVGPAQTVALLDLKPVAKDDSGELYRIGSGSSVVCYVRVQDRVQDGSGQPLEHWLSVPQHMATPHEAVAWSFGLADQDYTPSAET